MILVKQETAALVTKFQFYNWLANESNGMSIIMSLRAMS